MTDEIRTTAANKFKDCTFTQTIPVSLKLLREAHAVMRACGWHLAPASDQTDDPTLALAAAEIEDAFRTLTKGTAP